MSAEPAVGTGQVPMIRKFRQARTAEFCGGLARSTVFSPGLVGQVNFTATAPPVLAMTSPWGAKPASPVHAAARPRPGPDGRPLRTALPIPGAVAAPDRRLERHHRALRCPVWRAEGRHGHLDSHLPAH